MSRLKSTLLIFLICFLLFSCGNEEEAPGKTNITGEAVLNGRSFALKGGVLDEKADSLYQRRTFAFKLSPNPIENSITKTFQMYVSSSEDINIEFKLTSDQSGEFISTGEYSLTNTKPDSPDFPKGKILRNGQISLSDRTAATATISNYDVTDGTVTITGEFPVYSLSFSLKSSQGIVTGNASGEFITRKSWKNFFK